MPLSKDKQDQIKSMIKAGHVIEEIVAQVGCHRHTVTSYANRLGLTINKSLQSKYASPYRSFAILYDLMHSELSQNDIAAKHHVTKQRICKIKKIAQTVGFRLK